MSWHPIPTQASSGVVCTVTKTTVLLTIPDVVRQQAGWSEAPVLQAYGGAEEHAGWLRIDELPEGVPLSANERGELVLTVPRSVAPEASPGKNMLVLSRLVLGGLEIKLPMRRTDPSIPTLVASVAEPAGKNPPALVTALPAPAPKVATVHNIATPAEYQDLVRQAIARDIEIIFLSDGSVTIDRRKYPISELKSRVGRLMAAEKRGEVAV